MFNRVAMVYVYIHVSIKNSFDSHFKLYIINMNQGLAMTTLFFVRSKRIDEFLLTNSHRFYVLSYKSFELVVSDEYIFFLCFCQSQATLLHDGHVCYGSIQNDYFCFVEDCTNIIPAKYRFKMVIGFEGP